MTRISQWVRPNIRSLVPYSSAKSEFTGTDAIFMDANENPFGAYNRYPDPQQRALKVQLAENLQLTPEQLFVGNGSDEVIDLLLRIFCVPGKDAIGTFSPTYGMYEVSAQIHDLAVKTMPLDANFDLMETDFEALFEMSNLKIIFLCSPNNPTGNDLNRNRMLELIRGFNGIVCVDEAYIEFSEQKSLVDLIDQCDNLVVSRTMSKAQGLAGARVGYACASPELIALFNKVKPPYNVSSFNQQAALKALQEKEEFQRKRALILSERTQLIQALLSLPLVKSIFPSSANFILVTVNDADAIYYQLLSQNIIVRNRSQYVQNTLRISVGTPEENTQLINALKAVSL